MTAALPWLLAAAAFVLAAGWWREARRRAGERRRLEELGDKREAMRRCLEFLTEGVVLLGPEQEVLYLNPAAASMLRLTAPPPSGSRMPLAVLAPESGLDAFVARHEAGSSHRSVLEMRFSGARPEEPEERVSLEVTLADAGPRRSLLVLRDVGESEQINRKRQDFVANASHELKTPIAALIGLLDLMELVPEAKREDLVARARRNAQGLANMTEDLLALARAEAGEWHPQPRLLSLGEELQPLEETFVTAAEAKGLAISMELDEQLGELWLDPFVLRTVVQNLLANAVTYTEQGSVTLRAQLSDDGQRLLVAVTDTGPGIDPKLQPRIFERFFRVDVAHSRASGGTGLGLSIVRHLVRRSGGRLYLDSAPGKGSTFSVELPCRLAS